MATIHLFIGDVLSPDLRRHLPDLPPGAARWSLEWAMRPRDADRAAQRIGEQLAQRGDAHVLTNCANLIDRLPLDPEHHNLVVWTCEVSQPPRCWTEDEAERFWTAHARRTRFIGEILRVLGVWT